MVVLSANQMIMAGEIYVPGLLRQGKISAPTPRWFQPLYSTQAHDLPSTRCTTHNRGRLFQQTIKCNVESLDGNHQNALQNHFHELNVTQRTQAAQVAQRLRLI